MTNLAMNNKRFTQLKDEELYDVNGGGIGLAIAVAVVVVVVVIVVVAVVAYNNGYNGEMLDHKLRK